MYLLDTCIISHFFRKDNNIIQRMQSVSPVECYVSSITVHEIYYGFELNPAIEKKLKPAWETLIQQVQVCDYGVGDSIASAKIRSLLKSKGTPIGAYDVLLAGTAINNDLTFVTRNIGEFSRIADLKLEEW